MSEELEPSPYVAPARYVLTALHRIDPDREADLFSGPERIDGYTACGRPLLEGELWRRVEYRQEDRLCAGCWHGRRPAVDVQEALL